MDQRKRSKKIQAIFDLLEFSFLFKADQKKKLHEMIYNFSDEEISGLGKILAYEHRHRKELDEKMLQGIMEKLKG